MKSLNILGRVSRRIAGASLLAYGMLLPVVASAATQPSGGTLVGVVTCGDAATTPAANATVIVEGLNVETHTDAAGRFTLTGVPPMPNLTIDALTDSDRVVSSRYNVTVQAGQTLDIGLFDLAVCPPPPAPAPAPDDPQNEVRDA